MKGITPPANTATSLRTLLTMRKDHLAQAIIESQLKTPSTPRKRRSSAEVVEKFGIGKFLEFHDMQVYACMIIYAYNIYDFSKCLCCV